MINIIAIYRGQTLQDCRTVFVTSDERVVLPVIRTIVSQSVKPSDDPVHAATANGEMRALKEILRNG